MHLRAESCGQPQRRARRAVRARPPDGRHRDHHRAAARAADPALRHAPARDHVADPAFPAGRRHARALVRGPARARALGVIPHCSTRRRTGSRSSRGRSCCRRRHGHRHRALRRATVGRSADPARPAGRAGPRAGTAHVQAWQLAQLVARRSKLRACSRRQAVSSSRTPRSAPARARRTARPA